MQNVFHSHRFVWTLSVNVLVSLWKVYTIPLNLSSYTIASQGEQTAKQTPNAVLTAHNSYAHFKVCILFCARHSHFILSWKPSSAELYSGRIAPEMCIGVFLTWKWAPGAFQNILCDLETSIMLLFTACIHSIIFFWQFKVYEIYETIDYKFYSMKLKLRKENRSKLL